ncbi:N-acetyltransferase [bacterium]|nr:N-acetyltransferase [bacterium]RQV95285.1 MAG: N-acetyltransferase family protein [bacterium]
MIRPVEKGDAKVICKIYNHYIENSVITFEEEPIPVEEMQNRIREITVSLPWFVYQVGEKIIGYAYANRWKLKSAYRYAVETTIYLSPGETGRGIGSRLYGELIASLKTHHMHCAIGVITIPNPASIALHERMGFEKVAHFREVGWKFNQWIDVGYWELML